MKKLMVEFKEGFSIAWRLMRSGEGDGLNQVANLLINIVFIATVFIFFAILAGGK